MSEGDFGDFEKTPSYQNELQNSIDTKEQLEEEKQKEVVLDKTNNNDNNYQSQTPTQNNHKIENLKIDQNQVKSQFQDQSKNQFDKDILSDDFINPVGDQDFNDHSVNQYQQANIQENLNHQDVSFSPWGQINDVAESGGEGQEQGQVEINEKQDDWDDFGEFESKPSFKHEDISQSVSYIDSVAQKVVGDKENVHYDEEAKQSQFQEAVQNGTLKDDFSNQIPDEQENLDQQTRNRTNFSNAKFQNDFDEFEDFQEAQEPQIKGVPKVSNTNNEFSTTEFSKDEDEKFSDFNHTPENLKENQISTNESNVDVEDAPTQNTQAQNVELGQNSATFDKTSDQSNPQQTLNHVQALKTEIPNGQIEDKFDDFGEFSEQTFVSQQSFQLGQTSSDGHVPNVPVDVDEGHVRNVYVDDDGDDSFGDFDENKQVSMFDNQEKIDSSSEHEKNEGLGGFSEGHEAAPKNQQNLVLQQKILVQSSVNDEGSYDFGGFNEGGEQSPSDSQNQQQQIQQLKNDGFDDDDFGDFDEGQGFLNSQNLNPQYQQDQFEKQQNLDGFDDDDFGDFNEGDETPPQNTQQQIPQQLQQQNEQLDHQNSAEFDDDDDDDFGDFNEGDETTSPSSQQQTNQNQQKMSEKQLQEKNEESQSQQQQQQQQSQKSQNFRQINLLNMSQDQFSDAVNRLFSAVAQNLQQKSTQQSSNFEPSTNIQQISTDQFSTQLIYEQQNQLKKSIILKSSPQTFQSKQQENDKKFNWSSSNSENRLLQNLNLTNQAKEAKDQEIQKQIQQTQRKLKNREKSWKVPASRRRSKDGQKNNQNININQKSSNKISQEDSEVNKQQRIISSYLKQNSVVPRDLSGDPFAASGPVWNLEADMEGVLGVGVGGGGVVASSSSISAIHDDPFAFIFAGQQQSQTSAFNSGTTVDVSELDDFFSVSVESTPTAATAQARTDPFAITTQLDTLQQADFGDFISEQSKEMEDVASAGNVGDDKQETLNELLSKLPDLSYMLSHDVKIKKPSSR